MSAGPDAGDDVRRARQLAAALHRRIAALGDDELDLLFREARSHNGWQDRAVSEELLRAIYALVRMGPTCANSCPGRFLFLTSDAAKRKLLSVIDPDNVEKVLTAPVLAIIGHDSAFHRHMPRLFAHNPGMRELYAGNVTLAEVTAFRNGTLQGAYLMLAARALGLDCGPMSGFENDAVDRIFFPDSTVKSNFMCGIGYGDTDKLYQRLPRFEFDEVCEIL